jgi:hypothetical protein
MYYDWSILYLASCVTWSVRRLWSAPVRLYLLLVRLDLFAALCHNVLVATHVCSIMVFISGIDVTFSWLVFTLVMRWVALVIHIFVVVDGEWVLLVIIDDYSRSCAFCAYVICALTCLVVLVTYTCLQGELASLLNLTLVVFCLGFRGSMVFCIKKPHVLITTLLNSELDVCHPYGLVWGEACDLTWFEGELMSWCVYCIFCFPLAFSSYSPKSLCFT